MWYFSNEMGAGIGCMQCDQLCGGFMPGISCACNVVS